MKIPPQNYLVYLILVILQYRSAYLVFSRIAMDLIREFHRLKKIINKVYTGLKTFENTLSNCCHFVLILYLLNNII